MHLCMCHVLSLTKLQDTNLKKLLRCILLKIDVLGAARVPAPTGRCSRLGLDFGLDFRTSCNMNFTWLVNAEAAVKYSCPACVSAVALRHAWREPQRLRVARALARERVILGSVSIVVVFFVQSTGVDRGRVWDQLSKTKYSH